MLNRFADDGLDFISLDNGFCNQCKNISRSGLTCSAFPDGIPEEILRGEFDHREPYEGDNGIQFDAVGATV